MAHTEVFIILAGCMLSFFNLGGMGCSRPEPGNLPDPPARNRHRAAAGIGCIASITAPLIVPPLVAFGGTPLLHALLHRVPGSGDPCSSSLNAAANPSNELPPYDELSLLNALSEQSEGTAHLSLSPLTVHHTLKL